MHGNDHHEEIHKEIMYLLTFDVDLIDVPWQLSTLLRLYALV